jgi:hypothetical protein
MRFRSNQSSTQRQLPTAAATTTAAAVAATTTTTATTAAARTATAGRTLLRLVHTKRTTAHVFTIQRLNGTSRIGTRHFDEPEATRTSGFAIVNKRDGFHGAVRFKQLAHLTFVCREWQVTHIDLCHIDTVSLK